jgi:hypothetical protein
MFQTKVVEKIKTHILCSITCPRKSCRLWDNVEKYGTARQTTDDNIIRRMRLACWITKATGTQSEYVILITFRQQQRLRERASMLRYSTLPILFMWSTVALNFLTGCIFLPWPVYVCVCACVRVCVCVCEREREFLWHFESNETESVFRWLLQCDYDFYFHRFVLTFRWKLLCFHV